RKTTFGTVSGSRKYTITSIKPSKQSGVYILKIKQEKHEGFEFEEYYVSPVSIIIKRAGFSADLSNYGTTKEPMYLELMRIEDHKKISPLTPQENIFMGGNKRVDSNSLEIRLSTCAKSSGGSNRYEINIPPSEKVRIGKYIWTTKNATFDRFKNGDPICEAKNAKEWTSFWQNGIPCWSYYEYDQRTEKEFGKYYNSHVINDPRGIAPDGWRIPTKQDYEYLIGKVPEFYDNNKINESKLNTVGSGMNNMGHFEAQNTDWYIWGNSFDKSHPIALHHINHFFNHNPQLTISQEARSRNKSSAEIENWHYIDRGFSIRFVSDYSGNFEDIRSFEQFTNPELINVDGILVKKRELGELKNLWINDNLKPEIPIVSTPEDWKKSGIEGKPASCYYQFKPSNRHMGLYYNWYALSAISFERSRIPTKTDWLELSAVSSNVVTTSNSTSIFNGLLGGYCDDNGVFYNNELHGYWWLKSDTNNEVQWLTNSDDSTGEVQSDSKRKGFGYFIRYIRLD
ncbi:MAG: FISUMP domain-containing protein, partial [Ignavibacteria bacterium]